MKRLLDRFWCWVGDKIVAAQVRRTLMDAFNAVKAAKDRGELDMSKLTKIPECTCEACRRRADQRQKDVN